MMFESHQPVTSLVKTTGHRQTTEQCRKRTMRINKPRTWGCGLDHGWDVYRKGFLYDTYTSAVRRFRLFAEICQILNKSVLCKYTKFPHCTHVLNCIGIYWGYVAYLMLNVLTEYTPRLGRESGEMTDPQKTDEQFSMDTAQL